MRFKKIANTSMASLLISIQQRALNSRYKSNAHQKSFNWNWKEKNFNRVALVNYLVAFNGGWDSNYLEIGCAGNQLFDSVAARNKVGVDPLEGGTHRATSDAFFKANKQKFDVIFIDGLHEYEQVRRDALNALVAVKDGGWIAFHDLLPRTWKEHHVPRLQETWTGDCWKLAVELSFSTGLDFHIVEIDHGVGLLRKTSDTWHLPNMRDELLMAGFAKFVEKVDALPLIDFDSAIKMITDRVEGVSSS